MTTMQARRTASALQHFGLARDRMRAALARRAGMSGTDLDALEHLEAGGPLTQRELGDRLAITSGAVTMLVDRLERAGWVRRTPHPSDRRYVVLELTTEAEAKAPPGLGRFHERIQAIADAVPARHRHAVRTFLVDAAAAADAATRELGAGSRSDADPG
jgi:DNA-binding MarR family transcriptional regulator